MKRFFVYILASDRNGTLYTGVTSNLVQRIWQHKEKSAPGFTAQYNVDRLVYFVEMATAEQRSRRKNKLRNGIGLGNSG